MCMRAHSLAHTCLTDHICKLSCPPLSHACTPVAFHSASRHDPFATVRATGASETSLSAYTVPTRCLGGVGQQGADQRLPYLVGKGEICPVGKPCHQGDSRA